MFAYSKNKLYIIGFKFLKVLFIAWSLYNYVDNA